MKRCRVCIKSRLNRLSEEPGFILWLFKEPQSLLSSIKGPVIIMVNLEFMAINSSTLFTTFLVLEKKIELSISFKRAKFCIILCAVRLFPIFRWGHSWILAALQHPGFLHTETNINECHLLLPIVPQAFTKTRWNNSTWAKHLDPV